MNARQAEGPAAAAAAAAPSAGGDAAELWGTYRALARSRQVRQTIAPPPRTAATFPLSPAQERLWVLCQLAPASPHHNVARAFTLRGALDTPALAGALQQLARRHESLRTGIGVAAERPCQQVSDGVLRLRQLDLTVLPAVRAQAALAAAATTMARQPFRLDQPPLLRLVLVRLGIDHHVLLLVVHHIVFDGVSLRIFWRDLASLYRAQASGAAAASPLPALPFQYVDFAAWQRSEPPDPDLASHRAFWREHLASAPAVLDLPGDRPRPAVQSHRGGRVYLAPAAATGAALRALARGEDATLFMALIAAWAALLMRYTGGKDVVIGTPVANRGWRQLQGLIGCFVNTLALRVGVEPQLTCAELVRQVRASALGAYRHPLPIETVVEELRIARSLSHNPLFQVMFVLQVSPVAGLDLAGLRAKPLGLDDGSAAFDLTLEVEEAEGGLTAFLEYSADLFDRATAVRWARSCDNLLRAMAANPHRGVATLPLLAAAERHAVTCEWSAAATPGGGADQLPVHLLVLAQAERSPDAPAVCGGHQTLSYGELGRRVADLARALRRLGVGPETAVGVCLGRSPELIVSLLAVLAAGGFYVPIDPQLPRRRRLDMLRLAGASLLLTTGRSAGEWEGHAGTVLCVDEPAHMALLGPPRGGAVHPDNLAYVIFTSGSTGQPKAVQITHRSLAAYVVFAAHDLALGAADRVLQFASAGFDTAAEEIFPCLAAGATLVLRTDSMLDAPEVFLARCQALGVTVLDLPTAYWHEIGAWMARHPPALWQVLRLVIIGGERAHPDRLAEWRRRGGSRVRLVNTYGPTETTIAATWRELNGAGGAARTVPIGRPIPGRSAYLLDDRLLPVPIGAGGELCLAGSGLARGYLGAAATTAERFVPDPFGDQPGVRLYRTGDRVRHLPDGDLDFLGRRDGQVKVRGYRIELGEVEAALAAHPAVADCAVAAGGGEPGDSLTGFVVMQPGSAAAPADLRSFLAATLPAPMVPGTLTAVAALPRTASGKIDRQALHRLAGAASGWQSELPRTALEQWLAAVWRDVTGRHRIGRDDDFFQIGGHSLLAGRVLSRLYDEFAVRMTLRGFFDAPTLARQADMLQAAIAMHGGLSPAAAAPEPGAGVGRIPRTVAPGRPAPLSFAQQRLWLLDQLAPGSPAYVLAAGFTLRGHLDIGALAGALHLLAARHDVLRSRIVAAGAAPEQVAEQRVSLPVMVADLSGLPGARIDAEALLQAQRDAARPFALTRAPFLRVRLLRLAPRSHWLLLTMHHIISDAWSIEVLQRELAVAYAALLAGVAPRLRPLPIQYADFAVWQRQWMSGDELSRQASFWRERLAGAPRCTPVADRARPAVQTTRGRASDLTLPPDVAASLRRLGRDAGASLYMVLLALFCVVLRRHTGQSDLVLGSPAAGRGSSEVEGLIGFFVNTLVLRFDLGGNPAFTTLLASVRETALEAWANQDVPFEKLVEDLKPDRDLGSTPLFQVLFNMLYRQRQPFLLPGLSVEPLPPLTVESKFDLTLYAEERGDDGAIALSLVYNRDLFDSGHLDGMLAQLAQLAAAAAADPRRPIDGFSLRAGGAAALLPDPASPLAPTAWPGSVAARVAHWALLTPDSVAVEDDQECLTYAALEARSNRLANRLLARGVAVGDLIALEAGRNASLVWTLLGVMKAGAAFLILDPAYPRAMLDQLVEAAGPRLVLPLRGREDLAESPVGTVAAPVGEIRPDMLAYVAFTSGTTGTPKGICGTHQPLVHFLAWHSRRFNFGPSDRFSVLSGLAHDPLLRDLFTPLWVGGTACLPDAGQLGAPGWLASWLAQRAITIAHLTPAMAGLLSDSTPAPPHQAHTARSTRAGRPPIARPLPGLEPAGIAPGLRYLFFGGDALDRRTLASMRALLPRARCVNFYGTTETPQAVAFHAVAAGDLDSAALAGRVPVGRGIDGAELLILGPGGVPAAVGELGEIHVRSANLARGYLQSGAPREQRFVPNPWTGDPGDRLYRTGDLGRYLPNGEVDLLGRADRQVKIRGYRLELGQVESALERHRGVARAAVFAEEHPTLGRQLVACVVAKGPRPPGAAALRRHLARCLPAFAMPAAWVDIPRVPLTPNGKVDAVALAALARDRRPTIGRRAPRTAAERELAAIWSRIFNRQVGVRDNFFTLGGHSLLAVRMMATVARDLAVTLPLSSLFHAQTIEELARLLDAARPCRGADQRLTEEVSDVPVPSD